MPRGMASMGGGGRKRAKATKMKRIGECDGDREAEREEEMERVRDGERERDSEWMESHRRKFNYIDCVRSHTPDERYNQMMRPARSPRRCSQRSCHMPK